MPYAAMLIIGEGTSSPIEAEETARWHQEHGLWLSRQDGNLPSGTPVVARMAGPLNELLLDGLVSGPWTPSRLIKWQWTYELPVAWLAHVIRGILARDHLPENKALSRSSYVGLDRARWVDVQYARLRAA